MRESVLTDVVGGASHKADLVECDGSLPRVRQELDRAGTGFVDFQLFLDLLPKGVLMFCGRKWMVKTSGRVDARWRKEAGD